MLPLFIIPGVIGTAITLVLVNIFPARRTRDLLGLVTILAAGGLVLGEHLSATRTQDALTDYSDVRCGRRIAPGGHRDRVTAVRPLHYSCFCASMAYL